MTVTASTALSSIPTGLRKPLLKEYQTIVQNFFEHRWLPSELSGGRFSEIVYTILDGQAKKSYAASPSKPKDFVGACKKLENNSSPDVPRSFQILIPRLLPALYEVRNNRNIGHAGGDVDPNHMDSVAVLSMCNWIMGELVRVYHDLPINEAQQVVDTLAEIRIPIVWSGSSTKRVLQTSLKLPDQILLLVATTLPSVSVSKLIDWTEAKNKKHFMAQLRALHKKRLIEFNKNTNEVELLPGGAKYVQQLVNKNNLADIV